ncbi:MAG TPA: N-acetylmuramoyl-L-alanine amidase [Gammaproteobacteria bacterium]|nr:N-acetylmuramoyl-L-alanine amidase [Gammaproteobacteria bacterium]
MADALPPLIADAEAGVTAGSVVGVEWARRLDTAGDYRALFEQPDVALAGLFGLDVRTIVIDPGHGGDDPGAIGANGLKEKDISLEIARLLYERLLGEEGINVVLTRDSDITLSLKQRVEYAVQQGADLLISIHLNTIPNDPMTIVETYYFGTPRDYQSLKVASLENHHSEYAVGEFDQLVAQLGDALKQQESRKLASHIQRSVYRTLRRGNRHIIDAGIKSAPFVVLLGSGIPSVLAEVTCISNTAEEARLATPEYRDTIAGALEKGVLSYLNQLREQERQRPEQGSNTYAESQG